MMIEESTLQYFNLYNPASLPKKVLLEEFVARREMLDEILDIIGANRAGEPQQHLLLVGPRGMGKTTMLFAVKYTVEDHPEIGREWLPLIFSEENYGIGDLADFWLEAIRSIEGELNLWSERAEELLEKNPPDLSTQAMDTFFGILDKTGKRALLLLDNLNEILSAIGDEHELHALRALLMEDSRIMIIGGSASYFDEVQKIERPFYEFFRSFHLDRFNREEMEEVLKVIAQRRKDTNVLKILKTDPGRVQALRILTGGNPRLVKVVYRLLHDGAFGDIRHDLQRLLDDCTPYFKHRIETLKTPARRVFDAIARRWDPTGVGELTVSLRKKSNYVSAQIKRLVNDGFVEEHGGHEKKKRYQVAERFYNIYYLMRYSRTGRKRLEWLAAFMKVFYTMEDYNKWSGIMETEARSMSDNIQKEERLAYLSLMASSAEEGPMKASLLNRTICTTIDTAGYSALSRVLGRDLKKELGSHFSILQFLADLSEEERSEIGYKPGDACWWTNLAEILIQYEQFALAEQAYLKCIEIDPDFYTGWFYLGLLYHHYLSRYEEAEEAYHKSIELDSEISIPWITLGIIYHYHLDRYAEAEEAYRKAIELDSKDPEPWIFLGNLYRQHLSRYEEAEEAYRQAIELDSKKDRPWFNLGNLYQENFSRYAEAEKAYRRAIELDSKDAAPWINLGNLYMVHLSRYDEAEEAFRRAIKLDSKDAEPWNDLGKLYVEHLSRYDEAEEAYLKSIKLDSGNAPPHCGLAALFHKTGRDSQAVTEAITGLTMKPQHVYGQNIFKQIFSDDDPRPWLEVIPKVLEYLAQDSNDETTFGFAMHGLIRLAALDKESEVLELVEKEDMQIRFEPLLVAIRAGKDRAVLHRVSPEMRALVLEVMEKLSAEKDKN